MLYFSSDIKDQLPGFFTQVEKTLEVVKEPFQLLPPVGDIWCKDWMPIPDKSQNLIKFKFDPFYLRGIDEQPKPDVDMIANDLQLKYTMSDIVLDGGNFVRLDAKAIVTDKIFDENPWFEKTDLIRKIKAELNIKELIVIPREGNDFVGNADSMVRFIDEKTVFVNDYSYVNESFKEKLYAELRGQGLKLVPLPYMAQRDMFTGHSSAIGNYINFLEVGDKIVLPTFGLDSDRIAFDIVKTNRSQKEVVPLGSVELAKMGGVLNSISWSDQ